MCVESSVWWPRGAVGFSDAEVRCMKATGPSVASPTGAPVTLTRYAPTGACQTTASWLNRSCGCCRSMFSSRLYASPSWKSSE